MTKVILTLDDIVCIVPWRQELRSSASAAALRVAFELIGDRARETLLAVQDKDMIDYAERLRALDKACAAVLTVPEAASGTSAETAPETDPKVMRIAAEMVEINALATRLRELARPFVTGLSGRLDPRMKIEQRTFIWQAALMWETLTGKWPGSSRDGPFVDFCAAAWIECGMTDLGPDVEDALGFQIEKALSKDAIAKLAGG